MVDSIRRRSILQAGGAGLATALAGCWGGDGDDAPEYVPFLGGGGSEAEQVPAAMSEYLSASPVAPNFEGDMYVADAVGEDFLNVYVGSEEDYETPVFQPAAIKMHPDQTIRWNWIGDDDHAVRSTTDSDFELDSGAASTDREDYQVTFGAEGMVFYRCPRHGDTGMKGALYITTEGY